jgi:hypothetical protein
MGTAKTLNDFFNPIERYSPHMNRLKLTFAFFLCLFSVLVLTSTPGLAAGTATGNEPAKPTDTPDDSILVTKQYKTPKGIESITFGFNLKSRKVAIHFAQISGEGQNQKVSEQIYASPEGPLTGKITLFLAFANNTDAKDLRASIEINIQLLTTNHIRYSISNVPSNVKSLQVEQIEELADVYPGPGDPGAQWGACRQQCWDHFRYQACFTCCLLHACP